MIGYPIADMFVRRDVWNARLDKTRIVVNALNYILPSTTRRRRAEMIGCSLRRVVEEMSLLADVYDAS